MLKQLTKRIKHGINMNRWLYLILMFLASCTVSRADIPRNWLIEEVTIEKIHEHFYSMCLSLNERNIYIDEKMVPIKRSCEKGSGNPFNHDLTANYKVYRYDSPREYWKNLAGNRGFVLEINGKLVEAIETAVN